MTTHSLTHGAETLRSLQLCGHSRTSQHFTEPEGSLLCSQEPEGKRPLGLPSCRWVNSIKMVLKETGWDCMDWIDMAQGRDLWRDLVNTVMNRRVP
jgi:hypothetical protein